MKIIERQRLFHQIIIWFSIILFFPVAIQIYSFYNSKTILQGQIINSLETIAETKSKNIEDYARKIKHDIKALSSLIELLNYEKNIFENEKLEHESGRFEKQFSYFVDEMGYYDLFIINKEGDILFTIAKEDDFGTNLISGKYKDSHLAKNFKSAVGIAGAEISNFEFYAPSKKPAAFVTAPVIKDKKIIGAVALQINNDKLFEIVNDYMGLGQSGEIEVASKIGDSIMFAAPTRHNKNLAYTYIKEEKLSYAPISKAVAGNTGRALLKDYRNVDVVAVWRYLPSFGWGIVVKIDADEAFKSISELSKATFVSWVMLSFLIAVIMFFASKSISSPVYRLIKKAEEYKRGDFSDKAELGVNNEIGVLAGVMNSMAEAIEKNIEDIKRKKDEIELFNKDLEKMVEEKSSELKEYIKIVDKNVITSSTDLNGIITYVSEAFCKISGYSEKELIGRNHNIVRHGDMPSEIYEDLWATITKEEEWEGEVKNLKKDGGYYWVDVAISPIYKNGAHIGYTAVRQDITDKKKIEELSITDGMTNLYNRRHFNIVIEKEIKRAIREGKYLSFLIMDVDHFKQYNDMYGHQAGDDVLIKIGKVLKESVSRASDFAFRLGGEEFGIIFSGLNKERSLEFAQNIRERIEELKIEHKGNSAASHVTASMGLIVEKGEAIGDTDYLYRSADEALYKAKEGGRNRVVLSEA